MSTSRALFLRVERTCPSRTTDSIPHHRPGIPSLIPSFVTPDRIVTLGKSASTVFAQGNCCVSVPYQQWSSMPNYGFQGEDTVNTSTTSILKMNASKFIS
jgi:hypothetical protein